MIDFCVLPTKTKFPLGTFYVTPGVDKNISLQDVNEALARHARGDWGNVCAEDQRENELALVEGRRLLSVYQDAQGLKFWIITESDRSATTALLPDEY